jgi:L-iditol 2-dehydrogenase
LKAVYAEEKFKTAIREIDVPQLKSKEVLIKTIYAGICGSDLHVYMDAHAFRKPPVILGHELTGIVVEIGNEVTKVSVGDKVTVLPLKICGKCKMCREGYQQHCEYKIVPGTSKWIGAMVEYFNANEDLVYKLNDTIGLKLGVLAEPLAVAVHAINKIPKNHRNSLLILGGGTLGILILAVAKQIGFKKVMVTDIIDYNLEVALHYKADRVVNVLNESIEQAVREELGEEKADAVIITASAPNILEQAVICVGRTRTIVYLSMITTPITLNTYPIVYKEINLVGSLVYNEEDFREAIKLLSLDALNYEKLVTHCFDIDQVQRAFEMMESKKEGFVKVIIKI